MTIDFESIYLSVMIAKIWVNEILPLQLQFVLFLKTAKPMRKKEEKKWPAQEDFNK